MKIFCVLEFNLLLEPCAIQTTPASLSRPPCYCSVRGKVTLVKTNPSLAQRVVEGSALLDKKTKQNKNHSFSALHRNIYGSKSSNKIKVSLHACLLP